MPDPSEPTPLSPPPADPGSLARQRHEQARAALARGDLASAVDLARHAVAIDPSLVDAWLLLAQLAEGAGDAPEAAVRYKNAVERDPQLLEAWLGYGRSLRNAGNGIGAADAFRKALAIDPSSLPALNTLAVCLAEAGAWQQAVEPLERALAIDPASGATCCNLGVILTRLGRLDDAERLLRRAAGLIPDDAAVQLNLGSLLKDQGDIEGAIDAFRRGIAIDPQQADGHSSLILTLHYREGITVREIAEECRRWSERHAVPLRRLIRPPAVDRSKYRKLRIGYVSSDFWHHAIAFFLLPLFSNHARGDFDIVGYCDNRNTDITTERLRAMTSTWRSITGMGTEAVAELIRQDGIDILVDLKLHTGSNRLQVFALKPAPVQVCWLGYPGGTGLDTIDYRLSDRFMDPEKGPDGTGPLDGLYTEKTVRLPDCFWCYDPYDGADLPVSDLPALGEQEGGVTFGCLNTIAKVSDSTLALWGRVLEAVPRSRMRLLSTPGSHRERALARFARAGIEPARVAFVDKQPRRAYLAEYNAIDIGLDSTPYNGHTTSFDSFYMGVPVVTLPGETPPSRAGLSLLSNLGLPGLAARSADEFVTIAAGLAADLPRLAELRRGLRARMKASPLMDGPRFARNLEAAYRQMWRTYLAKK